MWICKWLKVVFCFVCLFVNILYSHYWGKIILLKAMKKSGRVMIWTLTRGNSWKTLSKRTAQRWLSDLQVSHMTCSLVWILHSFRQWSRTIKGASKKRKKLNFDMWCICWLPFWVVIVYEKHFKKQSVAELAQLLFCFLSSVYSLRKDYILYIFVSFSLQETNCIYEGYFGKGHNLKAVNSNLFRIAYLRVQQNTV